MSLCLLDCIQAVQRRFTPCGTDDEIHNVDDKFAWQMTQRISEITGHELKLGDLWVHVPLGCGNAKGVAFVGYITRAGELAIQVYEQARRHVGHGWYASEAMMERLKKQFA